MLAVAIGALIGMVGMLRAVVRQARALAILRVEAVASAREISRLSRDLANTQAERAFVLQFLRDFPHMTRELHAGLRERAIPQLLLKVAARAFEPHGAVVFVRRRSAESQSDRAGNLVVAASLPGAAALRLGTELAIGEGPVGYAAEAQRVMGQSDFESAPASERARIRRGQLAGFEAQLVAPMVFGDETLGAIALAGCSRTGDEAKAVLRLIAEAGAKAVKDAAAFQDIRTTAELDGLTGILNKRHTTQLLGEMVYDSSRRGAPVSVFLFDVDNFKHYNDSNGHLAGDELLRELARLVGDNLRRGDVFGRFGGEEFIVALPDTDRKQALAVAEKIRRAIATHPFAHGAGQPLGCLSVSGGVAAHPKDGRDSAAVLRAADKALYAAKGAGRNRVAAAELSYLDQEPAQAEVSRQ